MFDALFSGRIGEILAPLADPVDVFFRALETGDRDKMAEALASDAGLWQQRDRKGRSAAHATAKGSDLGLFDECLRQGLSASEADQRGNTPLHYACEGGSLDMVKHILGKQVDVLARNGANQTPYDCAESHVVRQYLLPIQLRVENERGIGVDAGLSMLISTPAAYGHYDVMPPPGATPAPEAVTPAPIAAPPAYAPPSANGVPTASGLAAPPASGPPPAAPATASMTSNGTPSNGSMYGSGAIAETASFVKDFTHVSRPIMADGFHTSHNDPTLMSKYKHTRSQMYAAAVPPPPTAAGPVNSYSAYANNMNPTQPRYVQYEINGKSGEDRTSSYTMHMAPRSVHTPPQAGTSPAQPPATPPGQPAFYALDAGSGVPAAAAPLADPAAANALMGSDSAAETVGVSEERGSIDAPVTEVWSSSSAVM